MAQAKKPQAAKPQATKGQAAKQGNPNLRIYNSARLVPSSAIKPIKGGRLNGFSSINPMWRIEKMTELYGPYGKDWFISIEKTDVVSIDITHETVLTVELHLFVREQGTEEFGKPAIGFGTSKLIAKETKGLRYDDDAHKKAITDAFGAAAKWFGVGGDVYYASEIAEDNKYDAPIYEQYVEPVQYQPQPPQPPQPATVTPVGEKLSNSEIISTEQASHLRGVLQKNGRDDAMALGYINGNSEQRRSFPADMLEDLTYGEYVMLLGFCK